MVIKVAVAAAAKAAVIEGVDNDGDDADDASDIDDVVVDENVEEDEDASVIELDPPTWWSA